MKFEIVGGIEPFDTIIAKADNGIGIYLCPAKLESEKEKFINLQIYSYPDYEIAKKKLREIGLFDFGVEVIDNLQPNVPFFKNCVRKRQFYSSHNINFGPVSLDYKIFNQNLEREEV